LPLGFEGVGHFAAREELFCVGPLIRIGGELGEASLAAMTRLDVLRRFDDLRAD
jgi:hypothetical protein